MGTSISDGKHDHFPYEHDHFKVVYQTTFSDTSKPCYLVIFHKISPLDWYLIPSFLDKTKTPNMTKPANDCVCTSRGLYHPLCIQEMTGICCRNPHQLTIAGLFLKNRHIILLRGAGQMLFLWVQQRYNRSVFYSSPHKLGYGAPDTVTMVANGGS